LSLGAISSNVMVSIKKSQQCAYVTCRYPHLSSEPKAKWSHYHTDTGSLLF
jgi:hypothetical protein